MKMVRPPAVAGMFYPDDPHALDRQIEELLESVRAKPLNGSLIALVSPHAGYIYSGKTAAHAFVLLRGLSFDTVVIVAPSHREYFDGISVYEGNAYRTPLGDVPLDEDLRSSVAAGDEIIAVSDVGHRSEHAVEVQIPFLQKVLNNFRILPIVMGDQRREYCMHLGVKLADATRGKKVLLLASTDLSHYHPYRAAMDLDKIVIDEVRDLNFEMLMNDLEDERAEACGGGPTVAVLQAATTLGANRGHILHACNSGDVTGDTSGVVGYVSAAITRN